MAYSKIKRICIIILIFIIRYSLYGNENITVASKLLKKTDKYISFNVYLINNTSDVYYFYPNGIFSIYDINDSTLVITTNNDINYGEDFIAAHPPYYEKLKCIELKPHKKIKYHYKFKIYSDLSKISKFQLSICVIDKNLTDLKSFEEYLYEIKSNLLADKKYLISE